MNPLQTIAIAIAFYLPGLLCIAGAVTELMDGKPLQAFLTMLLAPVPLLNWLTAIGIWT